MSAPEQLDEIETMFHEGLATDVIKYAVARLLEDSDPADLLNDAPDYLGLDGLPDEDWDRVRDLVDAAETELEVGWHG